MQLLFLLPTFRHHATFTLADLRESPKVFSKMLQSSYTYIITSNIQLLMVVLFKYRLKVTSFWLLQRGGVIVIVVFVKVFRSAGISGEVIMDCCCCFLSRSSQLPFVIWCGNHRGSGQSRFVVVVGFAEVIARTCGG